MLPSAMGACGPRNAPPNLALCFVTGAEGSSFLSGVSKGLYRAQHLLRAVARL